ncbi:hypothetical protein SAMN05444722_2867 [Rhodovulum sp. ES.010]|uniref:hypothetical protein n=1 Tax=Rhodovulum sp. ES.010 TaxID=1882821 RepID=UPI000927C346|nr:hypothetical protein [Rhodovulum sp. ES.010]SIO50900.1 hypothetical protein SAMN05444722_2867 [Rhodovulum sp. ES.010]
MQKLYAISCVTGWGFFYAFTFLALTSLDGAAWMPATYAVLAFGGFLTGMLCWVRIVGGKRRQLKPAPVRARRRPEFTREIA